MPTPLQQQELEMAAATRRDRGEGSDDILDALPHIVQRAALYIGVAAALLAGSFLMFGTVAITADARVAVSDNQSGFTTALPDSDARWLEPGDAVTVRFADSDRSLAGEVFAIEPAGAEALAEVDITWVDGTWVDGTAPDPNVAGDATVVLGRRPLWSVLFPPTP